MTTYLAQNVECQHCRTVGTVFWAESGYRDQNESVTGIWGEFVSRPASAVDGLGGITFEVVCARCDRPATLGASRLDTPARRRERGLARRASVIRFDREVILRVHRAAEVEIEALLTPRAAMAVAADLLNAALVAGCGARTHNDTDRLAGLASARNP
jgi:hypothetical protein